MSDSLTRLILRAQGALSRIEPLLPSRYGAPVPGLMDLDEGLPAMQRPPALPEALDTTAEPLAVVAAPVPRPAAATDDPVEPPNPYAIVADMPSRPQVVPDTVPSGEQRTRLRTPAQQPEDDAPAAAPTRIARAATPSPGLRSEPNRPNALAVNVEAGKLAETAVRPTGRTGADQAAQSPPPGRPPIQPMGSAYRPAAEKAMPAPSGRPEVRISIGRVEVHALPPPPRTVRQAPPRRPTVSLADYLARRGGRAP